MRLLMLTLMALVVIFIPIIFILAGSKRKPKRIVNTRENKTLDTPMARVKTEFTEFKVIMMGDVITDILKNIKEEYNNNFFQDVARRAPTYNSMVRKRGIYFNMVGQELQIIILSGEGVVKIQQGTDLKWSLRDSNHLNMLKDIEYLWNNRELVTNALTAFATDVLHKREIVNFTHIGMKRLIHTKIDYGIPYLYLDRGTNKSVMSFCVFINRNLYSVTTDVDGYIVRKDGIDIDPYHFYTDVINATNVKSVSELNFNME